MVFFCYDDFFQIYKHEKRITSVHVQGSLLASGSYDKKVRVWNMKMNRQVAQFQHESDVRCVQLHNTLVLSASLDNSVKIWELETGEALHKLAHSGSCNNFDLSPSQTVLAVACQNAVVLWDFKTAKLFRRNKSKSSIFGTIFSTFDSTLLAIHLSQV